MKRFIRPVAILGLFALVFTSFPPPQVSQAALDTEPTRKVEIQIQYSKVDLPLSNFPVLLTEENIPSEACDADGSSPAQNGGGDIRFTSDEEGNDQLALEIVTFTTDNDPANCVVEMYVEVSSISSTFDTSIWMWYNTSISDSQPATSSTYGSESVWDNNYQGVWHFSESSGSRSDSTSNGNTLSDNNTVGSTTGKWGTAADFERDNSEFLNITDGSQTGLDITGDMTFSGWMKMETHPSENYIASKWDGTGNNRSHVIAYYNDSGTKSFTSSYSSNGAGGSSIYTGKAEQEISTGTWVYVAAVFDVSETEITYYVNGSSIADTSSDSDTPTSIHNGSADFNIGHDCCSDYFDGSMQAIRLSSVARSDAWVDTSYENQNDPGAFAIEEAPVAASSAPSTSSDIKGSDESVTSSTTLQNDDDFSFTLEANKEYVLTSGVFATSTSGQPDIKIGFTVPGGATMDIGYLAQGGNARRAGLLETSGTASSRIPIPANNTTIIQAFGSIVTGSTGGTLNFQWSQMTSNANATKVKQGSFMSISEVTE